MSRFFQDETSSEPRASKMTREEVIRDLQERYRRADRSLNEMQRRHWAAVEAQQLGRGGITIVSQALRISPNTIRKGIHELESSGGAPASVTTTRIRKPGGGRKSKNA